MAEDIRQKKEQNCDKVVELVGGGYFIPKASPSISLKTNIKMCFVNKKEILVFPAKFSLHTYNPAPPLLPPPP